MKRIGVLGGTFNPIHLAHLVMAQTVKEQLKLNKVIFIPSAIPPHKRLKNLASSKDRYNMVKLAIKENSDFEISNYEIKKGGKSYTVDTLKYFTEKYPNNTKFYFIVGGDSVSQLLNWKNINEILKLASFVSVNRPRYINKRKSIKYHNVSMPGIEISSSNIRKKLSQGKSIKYLVPKPVFEYIRGHKLYRKM